MATLLRPLLPRLRQSQAILSSHPSSLRFSRLQPNLTRLSHFQSRLWIRPTLRASPKRTYFSRSTPKSDARPNPDPTPNLGSPAPKPSLSQRLKDLSKKYGWAAVGVYLGLSALDFPFCYLAVRHLGAERIGKWEQAVVDKFWEIVPISRPEKKEVEPELQTIGGAAERESSSVAVADARFENASIWTQLALAYAVHKSLIVFRVPLTAAVLPKVVKTLRSWGWNIGKPKPV